MSKYGKGIYVASKTIHAPRWRKLRDSGVNIISSWIDEAGEGETVDMGELWVRNIDEAFNAAALVALNRGGELMKGALAEIGAALAGETPVFWAGRESDFEGEEITLVRHPLVTRCISVEHAMRKAVAAAALAGACEKQLWGDL